MNHYLLVKIGDEVKEFKLLFISNKELDERELYKWIKELEQGNQKKPTIEEIEIKKQTIREVLNVRFDSKQLQQKAAEHIEKRFKSKFIILRFLFVNFCVGLTDPEQKRGYLISKINEVERQYFEVPSFELQRQIANLRQELKTLNSQIKTKKSRNGSVEKYYNKGKERRQLYMFKEGRKMGGIVDEKCNIHARTIGNPVNMWSMKEDALE